VLSMSDCLIIKIYNKNGQFISSTMPLVSFLPEQEFKDYRKFCLQNSNAPIDIKMDLQNVRVNENKIQ